MYDYFTNAHTNSMEKEVYTQDPQLRDYFLSLPKELQQKLLDTQVPIASLGELMSVAENMRRQI